MQAAFLPLFVAIVPMPPGTLMISEVHVMARNGPGNCGIKVFAARRYGRPLFDWMTSVTHHNLHHSEARYNLGLYFTWWNRWIGTEHPGYHDIFAKVVNRPEKCAFSGA